MEAKEDTTLGKDNKSVFNIVTDELEDLSNLIINTGSDEESVLDFSDGAISPLSSSPESDYDYSALRDEVVELVESREQDEEAPNEEYEKDARMGGLPIDFVKGFKRLWKPITLGGVVALSDSDSDSDGAPDDTTGAKCSVHSCHSRTSVKPRSRLVNAYYDLNPDDSPIICRQCFVKAAKFYVKIAMIGPNTCKFLVNDIAMKSPPTINIDDSTPPSGGSCVKRIEDDSLAPDVCRNILEYVNNVAEKYAIESKFNQLLSKLEKKIGGMTVWINELNCKLGMDDACIVEALQEVYKGYIPPCQNIKTLTLDMNIVNPDNPLMIQEHGQNERLESKEARQVKLKPLEDKGPINLDTFSDPDIAIVEENTTPSSSSSKPCNLPPRGMIIRRKPLVGQTVYVSTEGISNTDWVPAVIESIMINEESSNQLSYTYKVAIGPKPSLGYVKEVTEDQMAYHEKSSVRIAVGNRVISLLHQKRNNTNVPSKFYSGVVAESPSFNNQYRYLIMFENMAVQYSHHDDIRVICEIKHDVHHYFPEAYQPFIRKYFEVLPKRKILTVNTMDTVKVEYRGVWHDATVMAVDGLLMEVFYRTNIPTEWLYRGSPRVMSLDLYRARLMRPNTDGAGVVKNVPRAGVQGDHEDVQGEGVDTERSKENVTKSKGSDETTQVRSVAKKSTTRLPDMSKNLATVGSKTYNTVLRTDITRPPPNRPSKKGRDEFAGFIKNVKDMGSFILPKDLGVHDCSEACIIWTKITLDDCRGKNPLSIPMMFAFRRVDVTHMGMGGGGAVKQILYESPCGKRLDNFDELLAYLQKTKCQLSVDYFDFDPWVNVWDEFQTPSSAVVVKDLSYGKEFNAIPVVNALDREVPPYMNYEVSRIARDGVPLNLDPEFLTGCDCTDDCSNKLTCPCWQKTIKDYMDLIVGSNPDINPDAMDYSFIGYQNKRLVEYVPSGIYECNSTCKCSHTCLNRVVQLPLKVKLQLFKTEYKGWGTRCLNDIPAGGFICVYVGSLLTEKAANEDGKAYGDEYFAELDYIEVMERLMNKPGYESGPSDPELSDDDIEEVEDEFVDGNSSEKTPSHSTMELRVRRKEKEKSRIKRSTTDQGQIRRTQPRVLDEITIKEIETVIGNVIIRPSNTGLDDSTTSSNQDEKMDVENTSITYKPLRHLYGNNESVYIIDAKAAGNIGRYFNHSCEPNIFVQNVFVDTHDLRFPWVAFFARHHIRAGTELTWDYQYIVDSVPGKKLFCYCRTESCRGRLL